MIKYLTVLGILSLGILSGCQDDVNVDKCKGQILSINGEEAEVVYQTSDGKYHEEEYDFDSYLQRDNFHVNQEVICYVRGDGEIQEIATK